MAPWCINITERRHQVAALRDSLDLDRAVTVCVVQSAQCTMNCRDPICSRQFSRVVNSHSREYVRRALGHAKLGLFSSGGAASALSHRTIKRNTQLKFEDWVKACKNIRTLNGYYKCRFYLACNCIILFYIYICLYKLQYFIICSNLIKHTGVYQAYMFCRWSSYWTYQRCDLIQNRNDTYY